MRIAAQIFVGYGLLLCLGCLWRVLPFEQISPNVLALCAVYLGLTARHRLAPSTFGAVLLGYLADLLFGTPRGALALVAGVLCVLGHVIHSRLIVRGWIIIVVLSFVSGFVGGGLSALERWYMGITVVGIDKELVVLLYSSLLTALIGPFVFRLCRWVDAQFARTNREREATLDGLAL